LAVFLACAVAVLGAQSFWWRYEAGSLSAGSPGAWLTTSSGVAFRLDDLAAVDLSDDASAELPIVPLPGASLVLATVSARVPTDDLSSICDLRLVGEGSDQWMAVADVSLNSYGLCQASRESGGEAQADVYFEIPDAFIDDLRGVAVEPPRSGLTPVGLLTW
jgi:hypothetical protein